MHTVPTPLNLDEQAILAALAAEAIVRELESGVPSATPFGTSSGTSPRKSADAIAARAAGFPSLCAQVGAFVTLTRRGQLRGCIGHLSADAPLYVTVADMARAAAFGDPRFPPLQAAEWPDTAMEISVLSAITPCPDAGAIAVGRHGLVLMQGRHSGVFLPQVPVEQGWNLEQYLEALCGKAGLPSGSWRAPDARLFWFEAQVFVAREPQG